MLGFAMQAHMNHLCGYAHAADQTKVHELHMLVWRFDEHLW